jgi:hypothetical protein
LKAQTDRLRPYACDLSADRYGEGAAGLGIDRRSKNECTVDRFGNSGNLHAGSKQVAARLQLTADHGQDARVIRTAVRLQRMLGSGPGRVSV